MCPLLKAYCALIPSDIHFTTSFSESFERQRALVQAVEKEAGPESVSALCDPHGLARTKQRAWMASNFFLNVALISGDVWQIIRRDDRPLPVMSRKNDILDPEYLDLWIQLTDRSINEALVSHVVFKLDTAAEQRGPRQLADARREKEKLALVATRAGILAAQTYAREQTCEHAREIGKAFFEVCYTHGSPDFAVEQGKRLLEVTADDYG